MTSSDINTVKTLHNLNKLGAVGLLACGLLLAGCQGADAVSGGANVQLRSETLLAGDLESINGSYGAGCTERTGDWSVKIDPAAVLDNAELSVILNDVGCVLTMTELRTTSLGVLAADPSIALGTAYKGSPSNFDDEFWGNAKLDSVSFDDDFVITILYSDDPNSAVDDQAASFEVFQSSAEGDSVSAPNYMFDPSGLVIVTDAGDIVQSASGTAALTAGSVTGQRYVVADASGLDTYAELDAAYIAGTDVAIAATIPASAFTLVGEDLTTPQIRTLIIANTESGVASYQSFEITFNPAG